MVALLPSSSLLLLRCSCVCRFRRRVKRHGSPTSTAAFTVDACKLRPVLTFTGRPGGFAAGLGGRGPGGGALFFSSCIAADEPTADDVTSRKKEDALTAVVAEHAVEFFAISPPSSLVIDNLRFAPFAPTKLVALLETTINQGPVLTHE